MYGVKYDFGVYPESAADPDSDVLASCKTSPKKADSNVADIQRLLQDIGYKIDEDGIYNLQTKNCVKAFKNHYQCTDVVKYLELKDDFKLYENYKDHDPYFVKVTAKDCDIMGEVADLLGH